MCCQPSNRRGLPAPETDPRRRYSIRMQPGWNQATSAARPPLSPTGAGRYVNIFSFRSREKNGLDFSSYRSGFFANHRNMRLTDHTSLAGWVISASAMMREDVSASSRRLPLFNPFHNAGYAVRVRNRGFEGSNAFT